MALFFLHPKFVTLFWFIINICLAQHHEHGISVRKVTTNKPSPLPITTQQPLIQRENEKVYDENNAMLLVTKEEEDDNNFEKEEFREDISWENDADLQGEVEHLGNREFFTYNSEILELSNDDEFEIGEIGNDGNTYREEEDSLLGKVDSFRIEEGMIDKGVGNTYGERRTSNKHKEEEQIDITQEARFYENSNAFELPQSGVYEQIYSDGSRYFGSFIRGRRHGKGLFCEATKSETTLKDEDDRINCYDGNWINDIREGYGTYRSHRFTYKGLWSNDMPNDYKGEIIYDKCAYYIGQVIDRLPNGKGIMKYYHNKQCNDENSENSENNNRDRGDNSNRDRGGKGSGSSSGSDVGEEDGDNGEEEDFKVSVYEGLFHNGLRDGVGTFTSFEGWSYEGLWKLDERHGHGKMITKSINNNEDNKDKNTDENHHNSENNDDETHNSKLSHVDKEIEDVILQEYDGNWMSNQRHGFGILKDFNANTVYEGEFEYDQPHGAGILYGSSFHPKSSSSSATTSATNKLSLYEGTWLEGKRHGFGKGILFNPLQRHFHIEKDLTLSKRIKKNKNNIKSSFTNDNKNNKKIGIKRVLNNNDEKMDNSIDEEELEFESEYNTHKEDGENFNEQNENYNKEAEDEEEEEVQGDFEENENGEDDEEEVGKYWWYEGRWDFDQPHGFGVLTLRKEILLVDQTTLKTSSSSSSTSSSTSSADMLNSIHVNITKCEGSFKHGYFHSTLDHERKIVNKHRFKDESSADGGGGGIEGVDMDGLVTCLTRKGQVIEYFKGEMFHGERDGIGTLMLLYPQVQVQDGNSGGDNSGDNGINSMISKSMFEKRQDNHIDNLFLNFKDNIVMIKQEYVGSFKNNMFHGKGSLVMTSSSSFISKNNHHLYKLKNILLKSKDNTDINSLSKLNINTIEFLVEQEYNKNVKNQNDQNEKDIVIYRYRGMFSNNVYHGKGFELYEDGSKFNGYVKNKTKNKATTVYT